jgi:hypothetical protein
MRMLVWLVALSGCVFYAKNTKQIRVVSEEVAQIPIQTGRPAITAGAFDSRIRMFASLTRTCDASIGTSDHARKALVLGSARERRYRLVIRIMLAPITLPISAVITTSSSGSQGHVPPDARSSKSGSNHVRSLFGRSARVSDGNLGDGGLEADGTAEH